MQWCPLGQPSSPHSLRAPTRPGAPLLSLSPGLAASTETSCDLAALKAERDWNLPAGILSAVGTVESGRAGRIGVAPWPWTINAAGHGAHYESKGDAVASVLTIMERGFPYIDVGCFQIDIAYHAGVFRSIDEAFDPEHNAQAAARILLTNRSNAPDWSTAIARYHSATPALGSPYLERVRNALPAATSRALFAQAQGAAPAILPEPIMTTAKLPVVIYGLPLSALPATAQSFRPRRERNR